MSFNLRTCGEVGKKYGAKGYMLTDWGCGEGHTHFPVWSLVPAALAAQYSWNVGEKQNGGMLKPDFIRAAEKFIDDTVFNAPVSNWLYKMQQYYLLEPERIHSSTIVQSISIRFFHLELLHDNPYENRVFVIEERMVVVITLFVVDGNKYNVLCWWYQLIDHDELHNHLSWLENDILYL